MNLGSTLSAHFSNAVSTENNSYLILFSSVLDALTLQHLLISMIDFSVRRKTTVYISPFDSGACKAGLHLYMEFANETWIMEIRRDMEIHIISDYPGSATSTSQAIRVTHLCQRKTKAGQTVLKNYTRFSGTFCRQRATNDFLFNRTKFVCRWCKIWRGLNSGCQNMVGGANVKSIKWWREKVSRDKDLCGYDHWIEISQTRRKVMRSGSESRICQQLRTHKLLTQAEKGYSVCRTIWGMKFYEAF